MDGRERWGRPGYTHPRQHRGQLESVFQAAHPRWIKRGELECTEGLILCFRGRSSRAGSRPEVAGRNQKTMALEPLSSPPRSHNWCLFRSPTEGPRAFLFSGTAFCSWPLQADMMGWRAGGMILDPPGVCPHRVWNTSAGNTSWGGTRNHILELSGRPFRLADILGGLIPEILS